MSAVKVSVVVPVYNQEQYLTECIQSLIQQTLQDIEVIFVDDGSTDGSHEILSRFMEKDARIKILYQKNQYAGVARNNGFTIAKGKYVCFLDSDDFFDPTLLEKVYSRAEETNAEIILFGAKRYNTVTKTTEEASWYFNRKHLPRGKEVFSRDDCPDKIMRLTSPAPWTKLYRSDFIREQDLKFQELQNSNDALFTLLAISIAKRISYVNEDLVYYRIGQTSNLQSVKEKYPTCFIEAYIQLYQELIRRHVFYQVEKSYVEVVISGCAYNLDTIKDPVARLCIFERIASSEFLQSGILDHEEDYYENRKNYYKVKSCIAVWQQHIQGGGIAGVIRNRMLHYFGKIC